MAVRKPKRAFWHRSGGTTALDGRALRAPVAAQYCVVWARSEEAGAFFWVEVEAHEAVLEVWGMRGLLGTHVRLRVATRAQHRAQRGALRIGGSLSRLGWLAGGRAAAGSIGVRGGVSNTRRGKKDRVERGGFAQKSATH